MPQTTQQSAIRAASAAAAMAGVESLLAWLVLVCVTERAPGVVVVVEGEVVDGANSGVVAASPGVVAVSLAMACALAGAASAMSVAALASARVSLCLGCGLRGCAMAVSMLVGGDGRQQQVCDGVEGVQQHLLGRLSGVDHAHALGLGARQLLVGGGDGGEELLTLALQAVGLL